MRLCHHNHWPPKCLRPARSKSPPVAFRVCTAGIFIALIVAIATAAARSQIVSVPSATESHGTTQPDQRKPLVLTAMMAAHQKRNMREHLIAVQDIVAALAVNDWPRVEQAASKIGYSPQMGRMCNMMGAATPGFAPMALRFHHTADRIAEAARRHDRQSALKALGDTLATCTACHSAFRQEVVDQQTWKRLTAEPK